MAFSLDLTGRAALVTGGSRGIGRGIALAFAGAGADVAVASRDVDRLEATAADIRDLGRRAVIARCDVTLREQVDGAVEAAAGALGRIDIAVHGVGVAPGAPAEELDREMWDEVLNTNLRAALDLAQAVYPHMVKAGGGSIITIGSAYSIFGSPYSVAYAASKGGVILLTRSLAVSWAGDGIRVNALVPGWIISDMTEPALTTPEIRGMIENRTPFGRFGEADEVAGAAVFLASDAAGFITGEALVVDGGYSIA